MALLARFELAADLVPLPRIRRLLAFALDVLLVVLVLGLLPILRQAAQGYLHTLPPESSIFQGLADLLAALDDLDLSPQLLGLGLYSGYAFVAWSWTSASIGKWLFGARLTRPDGGRVGPARAAIRLLAMLALSPGLALLVGRAVDPDLAPALGLLAATFPWWPAYLRSDGAALHDLIAGVRLVRLPETGFRRLTRGIMRRALSDVRWAAVILAGLLLLGGLVFTAARLGVDLSQPDGRPLVRPVDEVTQEALKGAILEYDRMEEHATFRLDASILEPRATREWLARKAEEFAELRRRGLRQEARLLDAQFKGFRWVGDDRAEVDVVETWVSVLGDAAGRVLQERPAHEVPQTAILVRERGRWKIADVRHYEPGAEPF